MQRFVLKSNSLNSGPKVTYLGIFRLKFENTLSDVKSSPSNLLKGKKSCKKKKKIQYRNENALFGCLRDEKYNSPLSNFSKR